MKKQEPQLTFDEKQAVLQMLLAQARANNTEAAIYLAKSFLKQAAIEVEVGPKLPQYTREQLLDLLRDHDVIEGTVITDDPPVWPRLTQPNTTQHVGSGNEIKVCQPEIEITRNPPIMLHGVGVAHSGSTADRNFGTITLRDPTVAPVDSVLVSDSAEDIDAACERLAASQRLRETPVSTPMAPLVSQSVSEALSEFDDE